MVLSQAALQPVPVLLREAESLQEAVLRWLGAVPPAAVLPPGVVLPLQAAASLQEAVQPLQELVPPPLMALELVPLQQLGALLQQAVLALLTLLEAHLPMEVGLLLLEVVWPQGLLLTLPEEVSMLAMVMWRMLATAGALLREQKSQLVSLLRVLFPKAIWLVPSVSGQLVKLLALAKSQPHQHHREPGRVKSATSQYKRLHRLPLPPDRTSTLRPALPPATLRQTR